MRGIDISQWNGWPLNKATTACYKKADFVIVKATQGTSKKNPRMAEMLEKASGDGKLLGVYHYAEGKDPVHEADALYNVASKWKGKAVPCLDWESGSNSKWGDKTWCRKFAERTKELWSVWPMVYVQASAIAQVASCHPECPLWVAGYPYDLPTWIVPKFKYGIKPWSEYAVWQFTSGKNTCDRDTSPLTKERWTAMCKGDDHPAKGTTPLEIAASQIGVKESPAGSNKVKYNTWFYGREVSGRAYPWCAVFVAWCFDKAGEKGKLAGVANRAYCPSYEAWARNAGKWRTKSHNAKAGDLVLYDWGGDGVADHIGIVESCGNGKVVAIEGNTAVGNDSNGGEVMRRTRNVKSVRGYVDMQPVKPVTGYVTKTTRYLYPEPKADKKKRIVKIPSGSKLTYLKEKKGNWRRVEFKGKRGWVYRMKNGSVILAAVRK